MRSGRQEKSDRGIQPEVAGPANAYQAYQLARYHFHKVSFADLRTSRAWLEEAVRMDDQFAPAHVALAEQAIMEALTGLQGPAHSFPRARDALKRATDLKLNSAEFYAVSGFANLICDWNFYDAEANLHKALDLNPHHTFAHKYLGEVLMFQGRANEAETFLRRALDIEPMNLHVGMILMLSCFLARNYQKLIEECEKLLAMHPRFFVAATYRCLAWEQQGRPNEAINEYERILREPDGEIARRFMGYAYGLAGDRDSALQTIEKLEIEGRQHYMSPTFQANIYAALNQREKALSCLEQALADRDPWLLLTGTDPRLDNLRRHSRFNELLLEVGLPHLAQIGIHDQPSTKESRVMSPERWQQIDELFHAALACEESERAEFLANRCAGDASLLHEVESLLSSLEAADDFIETPPADVAAEMLCTQRSAFEPGQQIENYRIVRQLGSGGMGEVYLAEDIRLNRKVALKLLPPHFTVNPDRVRRFEREARAASALNHPNIVTIYEIGQSNATHFIATEFVDGKTLRQLINEKPFTLNETLNVSIQVADALSGAHAAGIVHRDIKPENIMIRHDGYVKILDFGLAKLTEQQTIDADLETPTLLQSNPGLVMGTVQYMSPEQARAKNVGIGTDIWSLGIVMYELLAGHVPFNGETPSHVMVSLMEDELPALKRHARVPEELDRFVTRALCKNPNNRYQTAAQLARDLKALKQKLQLDGDRSAWLKQVPGDKEATDEPAERAPSAAATAPAELSSRQTSSGEHVLDRRKHYKLIFATFLVSLVAVAIVLGYAFRRRSTTGLTATSRSIAVLPFKNDTGDANVEYVSDGLSETLINDLSRLPELRVTARNSTFKYKSKDLDPREVARSLGVESILMGRIVYRGDQLLISVEVINGADGTHLWGDEYTRKASDLVLIKSEISRDIVRALRVRLTAGEQQQLARRETVNPQAYELLMKGRFYRSKGGTENGRKSLACFEEAIAVDPNYAPAHAELSRTLSAHVTNNLLHPKEGMPRAETAARRALELDEGLADAHLVMADVKMRNWEWLTAEREYKRALELNPNFSGAHIGYTFFLIIHRRDAEALAQARRARELDPLSTMANAVVVYGLILNRQFDEALDRVNQMLELDRGNPFVHVVLGQVYSAKGQHQQAVAAFQEAIRLGDDSPDEQVSLAQAFARSGQPEKARAIIQRLQREKRYVSHTNMALLYASLGDLEQAFSRLEVAYETRDQDLIWLRVTPISEQANSDPRFEDLLKRIGLK